MQDKLQKFTGTPPPGWKRWVALGRGVGRVPALPKHLRSIHTPLLLPCQWPNSTTSQLISAEIPNCRKFQAHLFSGWEFWSLLGVGSRQLPQSTPSTSLSPSSHTHIPQPLLCKLMAQVHILEFLEHVATFAATSTFQYWHLQRVKNNITYETI